MKQVVAALDREITRRRRLHADAVKHVESLTQEIDQLQRARDLVAGTGRKRGRPRKVSAGAAAQPKRSAGPTAISLVRSTLAEDLQGRAAQIAIAKKTGLNSGTVSHALHALADEGVVRDTGERAGRSRIFEVVSA